MPNALTRKFSGKGYTELATACGEVKKWCETTNGETLKFSISATLENPMEGQDDLFKPKRSHHKKKTEEVAT
jgi:hypothetical protein